MSLATQKDGASTNASPAVETAFAATGSAGSHSAAVSDPRAKLRALAEAMGAPCIVRDVDGDGYLLTLEPLQFIPLSHIGASN